jgi:hypothetical protein
MPNYEPHRGQTPVQSVLQRYRGDFGADFPRLLVGNHLASDRPNANASVRTLKLANCSADRTPSRSPLLSSRVRRAKESVMNFSMKLSPKIESIRRGAVAGAAALAFVGFAFGGWVTGVWRPR